MDAGIITAIVGAFTAAGAAAWKIIDRADKNRERREIKVEELLKARVASLEAAAKFGRRVHAAARSWREQLIANDIQPDPADWPKEDDDV